MSDHLDAPGLMSPGKDARTDITDVYAFQKPGDSSKSILMMNVNPLATTFADDFNSDAIYEIKIDTDGDAVAEVAFRITFSPKSGGAQTALVKRAVGAAAAGKGDDGTNIIHHAPVSFGSTPIVTTEGEFSFFAGLRSDPFFFDLLGFLNNLHFTGDDFFIDKNVFGMALEMPNASLGKNPNIGVWARVLIPRPDQLLQVDRTGRPAINTVFNHGPAKNLMNRIEPADDRSHFLASFVSTLETLGGYSASEATGIAKILLPDILTYNYSSSAGFLNGRNLTDDVIDIELNLITHGAITGDGVGPHTDLLSVFPYMGNPH